MRAYYREVDGYIVGDCPIREQALSIVVFFFQNRGLLLSPVWTTGERPGQEAVIGTWCGGEMVKDCGEKNDIQCWLEKYNQYWMSVHRSRSN